MHSWKIDETIMFSKELVTKNMARTERPDTVISTTGTKMLQDSIYSVLQVFILCIRYILWYILFQKGLLNVVDIVCQILDSANVDA